ncbi:MAG: T9SS type A sorting domain-containing protein [Bacteroidota bacterium]
MKKILIVVCFLIGNEIKGQNLVMNPSFEDTVQCPNYISQISRCLYWSNPWETANPDYFNTCDGNGLGGVPNNHFGYESAHLGDAYVGICTSKENVTTHIKFNYREYIEGQLLSPLIAGINYCVSFYVSAYDSVEYVSNNIGAYFSTVFIADTCNFCVMPYIPQVENPINNNLNSRNGWTEVSGSFIATGGERYIIIGNFKDTGSTVTTYMGWSTVYTDDVSAYYIDDVSVMPCDSLGGINEIEPEKQILNVRPNPSNGLYTISAKYNNLICEVEVFNSLGETVLNESLSLTNNLQIDLSNLANGVYLLKLKSQYKQYQIKLLKY